jgi:hypothetical protein
LHQGRSNQDYKLIFTLLNHLYGFSPKFATIDFERAIHQGIQSTFPNIQIRGCLFHLSQAVKKWMHSNDMREEFTVVNQVINDLANSIDDPTTELKGNINLFHQLFLFV